MSTFTEDELRAAVQAAGNWNTYVGVHAYTPTAIQRAIAAGVKVIEHGHLMDDATAKLIAEKGIWLSFQPFTDDGFVPPMAPANLLRLKEVWTGTEADDGAGQEVQAQGGMGYRHPVLGRGRDQAGHGAGEDDHSGTARRRLLAMATTANAELLKLSGRRDPYPGRLGAIEEGALADLLLVDGDPIANIRLLENPARTSWSS